MVRNVSVDLRDLQLRYCDSLQQTFGTACDDSDFGQSPSAKDFTANHSCSRTVRYLEVVRDLLL
jgi:hypothetical protein